MRRDTYTPLNAETEVDRAAARRSRIRLSMYADALIYSQEVDRRLGTDSAVAA